MVHNETLTNVFWGFFLIWFGVVTTYTAGNFAEALNHPIFALGTGILMLLLNLARSTLRLRLSVLTIGLGALLTIIYTPVAFFGVWVPFLPALLIIAGVALVIGAFRTRRYL